MSQKKNNYLPFKVANIIKFNYYKICFLVNKKPENKLYYVKKCLEIKPNNLYFNLKLANFYLLNNQVEKSAWHYKVFFSKKGKKKKEIYLKYANVLYELLEFGESQTILNEAMLHYPKDEKLNNLLFKVSMKVKDEKLILRQFNFLFDIQKHTTILDDKDFQFIFECALNNQSYGTMKKIFVWWDLIGENKNLIVKYRLQYYVLMKDWKNSNELISQKHREIDDDKALILKSMLSIIFNKKEAYNCLKNINAPNSNNKTPTKLILYNSGDTRIEFYKKDINTNSVMITFDAINMTWDKPSFAYKLLKKKDCDIIAIRKRKAKTYQQDLDKEIFVEIIKPMMEFYDKKYAYGFSLGAYNALYYATLLNCEILALAPRLSIHPVYGRKKIINKHQMLHDDYFIKNEDISPTIIYDPKNKLDHQFISKGILPSFPKAKLLKLRYVGHSVGPALLEMGYLKDVVNNFLNGKETKIRSVDRRKAPDYYKNLALKTYENKHYKCSINLSEIYLSNKSHDSRIVKNKIKCLKKLNRINDAIEYAKAKITEINQDLDLRLYLVDMYIETESYSMAKQEIQICLDLFGDSKKLHRRITKNELLVKQKKNINISKK